MPSRAVPVFASFFLALSLTACGGGDGSSSPSDNDIPPEVLPSSELSIAVSQSEPVAGAVQLSVVNGAAKPSVVSWYVDFRSIGSATSDTPVPWNTSKAPDGTHLVSARMLFSDGSSSELSRTVQVFNPPPVVEDPIFVVELLNPVGTFGSLGGEVLVSASSPVGIADVSVTIDGQPASSLNAPNVCSGRFGGRYSRNCEFTQNVFTYTLYLFTIPAAAACSGTHVVTVTATNTAGKARSFSFTVVNDSPGVTLTEAAIVAGTLTVRGTTCSNKPGPITVTARLGDYEFLQTTTQSSFSGSMTVSGLFPNTYVLQVTATDSAGVSTAGGRMVTVP
jgi:hypothetical protein